MASGSFFNSLILWLQSWNCVTGLTVLLWEDHFLFCSPCLSPSLSVPLLWMSPLLSSLVTEGEGKHSFPHTWSISFKSSRHSVLLNPTISRKTPAAWKKTQPSKKVCDELYVWFLLKPMEVVHALIMQALKTVTWFNIVRSYSTVLSFIRS